MWWSYFAGGESKPDSVKSNSEHTEPHGTKHLVTARPTNPTWSRVPKRLRTKRQGDITHAHLKEEGTIDSTGRQTLCNELTLHAHLKEEGTISPPG